MAYQNDETKKKKHNNTQYFKGIIISLEASEKDATHLNSIRNVTDDGAAFMNAVDYLTVSSQEVLDRLKIQHDINNEK